MFANVGISDGRQTRSTGPASFGVGGSSPIPNRNLDTFGIAYYYLGFSENFKNLAPALVPCATSRGLEFSTTWP